MRELSLFSGAGGGLLATQHLLGWTTIGYVEIDEYCQNVLLQRIEDGFLHPAPIFGDIRNFNRYFAECYKGVADIITAGFPCQPFSVAGKRKGKTDYRNLWPETRSTIRIIRPQYIFLENSPTIPIYEYAWEIFSDITSCGYNYEWTIISASDVGLIHKRDRWWLVAYPSNNRCEYAKYGRNRQDDKNKILGEIQAKRGYSITKNEFYEKIRSTEFIRSINGVANRVDRIKAIAEGQVPRVVEVAWKILNGQKDG